VSLRCEYDLGGKELYSVTWYKDGIEFFKFMPGSPGREYYIDGVYVDVSRSDHEQVTLLGPSMRKGAQLFTQRSYEYLRPFSLVLAKGFYLMAMLIGE